MIVVTNVCITTYTNATCSKQSERKCITPLRTKFGKTQPRTLKESTTHPICVIILSISPRYLIIHSKNAPLYRLCNDNSGVWNQMREFLESTLQTLVITSARMLDSEKTWSLIASWLGGARVSRSSVSSGELFINVMLIIPSSAQMCFQSPQRSPSILHA